jgi:prepilin-type N-terminal cleavage/methylation domain-containing protein
LIKVFEEKGFTLIEVLIGLIILAIGVLAVAGMQITSITGTSFSKNLTQASVIAQDRLEFLKGLPLNYVKLDTGTYPDPPDIGIFTRSYQATRNANPNYVTIIYTVSWLELVPPKKAVTHTVSFRTIKGR